MAVNPNDIILGGAGDPEPTPNPNPDPKAEPTPDPNPNPNPNPDPNDPPVDNPEPLVEGTQLETPDGNFTVDANGNLVKEDGSIFKEAKDVNQYIAQFDNPDENDNDFNLESLQNLVDVEITGDDGQAVEFTDDAVGRKAYIDKVIELKQNEASKIAMDTFFAKNPIVKQFNDFVTLGGDPRDFGKIPDRTGIQFDENNAEQHKAILKMAFAEKGMKNADGYIKYLEDSGALADTAKAELEAIKRADAEYKAELAANAKAAREREIAETREFYNRLLNRINSGIIGGYKIPENVTVEREGQKLNLNRKDFFDYVSRVDSEGKTAYMRDLEAMNDTDFENRELLDAWMHFTGGSYKTLVDMAVKENEVAKLRLVAKKASAKSKGTVQIHKPNGGSSIKDVIL